MRDWLARARAVPRRRRSSAFLFGETAHLDEHMRNDVGLPAREGTPRIIRRGN